MEGEDQYGFSYPLSPHKFVFLPILILKGLLLEFNRNALNHPFG
jgi:hypothetical protein